MSQVPAVGPLKENFFFSGLEYFETTYGESKSHHRLHFYKIWIARHGKELL